MFILPFFLQPAVPSGIPWGLQPITVFLENRGKQLCQVEDAEEWLQENGFVVKTSWKDKNIVFAEIDTAGTQLKDFYSFEQLTQQQQKGTEECWRTFFLMTSVEEKDSCDAWNSFIDPILLPSLRAIQTKCKL